MSAVFARNEKRGIIFGYSSVRQKVVPERTRQDNGMSFSALAVKRDLSRFAVRLNVPPLDGANCGHSCAGCIEEPQQHAIPAFRRQSDHLMNFRFWQDALRKRVHCLRRTHRSGDRETEPAELQTEAEQ